MSARRPLAWPLVPLYRAALAAEGAMREVGLARERRLAWPVVSVGSVSAGGAGKTPVVIALAKLLTERGWRVDVLSRGYGRSGRGVERVEPEFPDAARRFGDEPTLIARRTEASVWVGASRYAAGLAAEAHAGGHLRRATDKDGGPGSRTPGVAASPSSFSAGESHPSDLEGPSAQEPRRVHLLDDGMQHRELARTFELALVTAADLRDTLLPAGNLREPLTALRRAHALAVREEDLQAVEAPLRALVGPDIPLWTVRRMLRFPAPLGVFGAGLRPIAFCALARPEDFAAMLGKAGCGVVDTVIFDDHHRYGERDLTELINLAKRLRATGLVTTEKDAVKLTATMRARLEKEIGPVMVVALDAAFVYESPVMRLLEGRLRGPVADSQAADEVRSR